MIGYQAFADMTQSSDSNERGHAAEDPQKLAR